VFDDIAHTDFTTTVVMAVKLSVIMTCRTWLEQQSWPLRCCSWNRIHLRLTMQEHVPNETAGKNHSWFSEYHILHTAASEHVRGFHFVGATI